MIIMLINEETVDKLSILARIAVTSEEKQRLAENLSQIVLYIESLSDLQIPESFSPEYTSVNHIKDDQSYLYQDLNLVVDAFPENELGSLKVPKIFEN